MKRTALKRRGRSRFPKRRDPAFITWVKQQPCVLTGVMTGGRIVVDPAHVRSRGAGGDDLGNVVPLEHSLHRELHQRGRETFEALWGVDLAKEAERVAEQYLTETFVDWVRTLPCAVMGRHRPVEDGFPVSWHRCVGRVEPDHVQTRGAGGADRGNVVPLCGLAHAERHHIGLASFQARYQVDLGAVAVELAARYPGAPEPRRGTPWTADDVASLGDET